MKKLLMFLVLLSVSLGMRAADISGTGISGATDNSSGKKVQTLVINTPGALATWVAAHTDNNYDTNNPFGGLGGDNDFYSLKISGELNAADLAALNSTTCAAFSRFPRIDMSEVTLAEETTSKDVCSVVFGPASFQKNNETITGNGATFIVLPNGITSADDVTLMGKMKAKGNSALKVVGAYDGTNTDLPELALYSFAENELSNFSSQMMNLADKAMVARLAGTYGDKDLMNNNSPVFGWTPPCIWDFTGATFTSCSLNPGVQTSYHAYNDPFCDGPTSKPGDDYQTNAFFYFANYSTKVVDIKLPTGITVLPPLCLNTLGSENIKNAKHKAAYLAHYGISESEMTTNYAISDNCALIPTLTIPDNYTKLDYQCGQQSYIQHLVIGGGMKIVEGGAFYNCIYLEDLDFGSGLSNCYLGEDAFRGQQNSVMKHIALSEGIVSIGANCFRNAQQMESIRLPQSLINIGDNAFDNCLALNSITIPENVDKIGKDAFKLCPFTDIYLTTTDPNKIPMIFTGGNNFHSWGTGASFHHGHYDGWEGMDGIHAGSTPDGLSWDDAVDWYFINCNGLPVLHYPTQLAEKVRADISANYHAHSSDNPSLGLPTSADEHARETAGGANVGTSGQGIYTRDGWAQFMLMKEFTTDPGSDLYEKEYDDVWYTMCFPFDLSDEQLAGAFNETFNIVDFSGVEVVEANKDVEPNTPLTLILHFNNVAMTDYKDTDGNHYKRVMQNGKPLREKDPTSKFEYNVYNKVNPDGTVNTAVKYHHVNTSSQLSSNKTKTFATGETMADAQTNFNSTKEAVIIDGILATAGHPYMIHPAIGVNNGGENKKKCSFSGIKWLGQSQWAKAFEDNSRTIDLGVRKTLEEKPDSNYNQEAYSKYAGQKYTFIGNSKEYRDGAAIDDEPQVPAEKPVKPVKPTQEEVDALKPTDARMDEDDAPKPVVTDPDLDAKYTEDFKTLFNTVRCHVYLGYSQELKVDLYQDYTYGEDLASLEYTDFVEFHDWTSTYAYCTRSTAHSENCNTSELKTYLGGSAELSSLETLNALQQLSKDYTTDKAKYAAYMVEFNKYIANRAAWAIYDAKLAEMTNWNQTQVDADYQAELNAYNAAVAAHNTWEENAKKWKTYIPKNAYFLGRKGTAYPKYYREIAENPADDQPSTRQGGAWTQFTAIIIPNAAAVNGIEKELDGAIGNNTKGLNMVFNEDFEGEFDPSEIKEIVAEAEEKGEKVQYMNIVYSINGEIVGQGSHSLSNLPQGMYIINGKKYLVK